MIVAYTAIKSIHMLVFYWNSLISFTYPQINDDTFTIFIEYEMQAVEWKKAANFNFENISKLGK